MKIFTKKKLYITIYFLFAIISILEGYKFDLPVNYRCVITLSKISHKTQAVIIDMDNSTDLFLKNCIVKGCSYDQTLLLFKGDEVPENAFKEGLKKIVKKNPNIVIITRSLDLQVLDLPILEFILKYQWSLLYIIFATDERLYKCKKGKYSRDIHDKMENFLTDLWHKYQIIYVVLALPLVCPRRFVVYDGKKLSNESLYDRTTKIIYADNHEELTSAVINSGKYMSHDYPLRANIFYRFPTSIKECEDISYYLTFNKKYTNGFCGLDGLVMHDIVKYFKFKLSTPKMKGDWNVYGYAKRDGTVTGSLGYIFRKEIDISLNSRFMVPYLDDGFTFLHYVSYDSLCALIKRPDMIPLWHYPYNAYDIRLWLLFISTLTVLGVLMWISAIITKQTTGVKAAKLHAYIFISITSGFFGLSLGKQTRFLILKGTCLICSIILLATYQGHVNFVFTTLKRYDTITSLKGLYEENIAIYTSPSIKSLLMPPADNLHANIMKHVYLWPEKNTSSFDYVLEHPNSATLERRSDVMLETLKYYTDERGNTMLYVVDECFRTYYLSYIARLGFPFSEEIRVFMARLLEAGLPDMYYLWTRNALGLFKVSTESASEPRPFSKITLQEQCLAFGLLLIGYAVSIAIFFGERRWTQNHNIE